MRVKDAVGQFGEDVAARHLTAAGFSIVERNWRPAPKSGTGVRGEIDIVAIDGDALVIVEVKTRSGVGFGSPAESVTADKRRRLRRLAVLWLAAHSGLGSGGYGSIRFDVISVLRFQDRLTVEHVRGAF